MPQSSVDSLLLRRSRLSLTGCSRSSFYIFQRSGLSLEIPRASAITSSLIKLMQLDKEDASTSTPQSSQLPPIAPLASQPAPPSIGPSSSQPSNSVPQLSSFFTSSFSPFVFHNLDYPSPRGASFPPVLISPPFLNNHPFLRLWSMHF